MPKLLKNFHWAFTGEPQEMLVDAGRVVWRGTRFEGETPKDIEDLGGKHLMPAFIDSHCHILPTGLDLQKLHLGSCSTREEVLAVVRERLASLEDHQWLMAVHYDQTKFPDGEHLTRVELDGISDTRPIVLRHVNGHASVANAEALKLAGVADDEPNPAGGEFARDASGRLTGVLLESAHERVTAAAPNPTLDEMCEAILRASQHMRELGIHCASDMMTGRFNLLQELEAYRRVAEMGSPIRFRLYLQWSEVFGGRAASREAIDEQIRLMDPITCKVAGIKIFADGAIGSATAAIYGRFSGHEAPGPTISRHGKSTSEFAPEGVETDGQLIYRPDKLKQMVLTAHEAGFQLAIHTIGDYSTDLVMEAYEATGDAKRHRIEHAMILSDAQIERMARLGSYCTMQPEFLLRFGHSYLRQLGPERRSMLERFRSVKDAGIPLSLSSDRPIVAGDPWDGVRSAVKRPEGFDQSENLTLNEALLGYTIEGAKANGDEGLMGELLPGQLADYEILDKPLSNS